LKVLGVVKVFARLVYRRVSLSTRMGALNGLPVKTKSSLTHLRNAIGLITIAMVRLMRVVTAKLVILGLAILKVEGAPNQGSRFLVLFHAALVPKNVWVVLGGSVTMSRAQPMRPVMEKIMIATGLSMMA
jgi:hypothetical protein